MDRPGIRLEVDVFLPDTVEDAAGNVRPCVVVTTCPHGAARSVWSRRTAGRPNIPILRRLVLCEHVRVLRCACAAYVWAFYGPEVMVQAVRLSHLPQEGETQRDSMEVLDHRKAYRNTMIMQRIGDDPSQPHKVWWSMRPWTDRERAMVRRRDDQ